MGLSANKIQFSYPNQEYIEFGNPQTIEGGQYFGQISNKSIQYIGSSPTFDFLNMPLYDSAGNKITSLNISHGYPQQGVLDEQTGDYYTLVGMGENSFKGYVHIAGISIPYNRCVGRLIKWHTTISGEFKYVGQCVLLGFSHQNLSIYNGNLFTTGANIYRITSNNGLDTYKDLRCFLIPLSDLNFGNPITDDCVVATPIIGKQFKGSYKGKVLSTDTMFGTSPDYDSNGNLVEKASWLYGLADSKHIFTSNGNNLYMYEVDLDNKKFLTKTPSLSNNLNLGNSEQVYSTDKNRIGKFALNNDTYADVNKYYMIKGRHVQSMTVRNNHLYITMGGVSYAHSPENVFCVKIIDLKTGMLIGELDVEDILKTFGSPVPSAYYVHRGTDNEGNPYAAITSGSAFLIQELEDIYVSEDESYIIIAYVISNPKYFKIPIKNNRLTKFTMLGDSYVQGYKLETKYNAYTLAAENLKYDYNMMGIAGNTVAEVEGRSPGQIPMVTRVKNIPSDANLIGIEGGRNDFSHLVPIGNDNDTTNRTFKGALNIICTELRNNHSKAVIFGVPCWKVTSINPNSAGITQEQYRNAFIDIVNKKYGYPVLDVTKVGVNMDEYTFRKNYCESDYDVSHLNKQGMLNYLPYLQSFISKVAK